MDLQRHNSRKKKDAYIKDLSRQQRYFLKASNHKTPQVPESHCCQLFSVFRRSGNSRGGTKHGRRESEFESNDDLANSREWFNYLIMQLQNCQDSSSNTYLQFSWPTELLQFIIDYEKQFNVTKYRGAIFYLNYTVR